MPKELHRRLSSEADKKGYTGERRKRYIYGGMRAAGWKPRKESGSKKGGSAKGRKR